jgi:lysine N6-hydroxylase
VRYFHGLAPARRKELLGAQQLASDGISADLLERVYRRMYENDFVDEHRVPCAVLPGRELHRAVSTVDGWRLDLAQCDTGAPETLRADTVVLATGYEFRLPEFLRPLADRIPVASDGQLALDADYSVPWDGPAGNKLFFLNAGRHSHGIADPNLSLASWRAATVLSSIADTPWDAGATTSTSRWASSAPCRTVPHRTVPHRTVPHRTGSADR